MGRTRKLSFPWKSEAGRQRRERERVKQALAANETSVQKQTGDEAILQTKTPRKQRNNQTDNKEENEQANEQESTEGRKAAKKLAIKCMFHGKEDWKRARMRCLFCWVCLVVSVWLQYVAVVCLFLFVCWFAFVLFCVLISLIVLSIVYAEEERVKKP